MTEKKKIRVLGISGSPRKAATYFAVNTALEELQKYGIETELLSFHQKKFSLCVDCGACLRADSLECVIHDDDMTGWATKFLEYDGYIIGSPVYDVNITAQLQGFFNRMRSNWLLLENEPHFFSNKIGASIAVGGSRYGGQELVLNAINNYYLSLGMKVISGGPYAYVGAGVWSKDLKKEGVQADLEGMQGIKAIATAVAKSLV